MNPAGHPVAETHVSVGQVVGLLEAVDEAGGMEDAAQIAREGKLHADQIPAIIALAQQLGLVDVDDGDVILKEAGRRVLAASIRDRKRAFAELVNGQAWMQEASRLLREGRGKATRAELIEALASKFGPFQAESLFTATVYWGRYAGLLTYSSRTEQLTLAT